MAPRQQREREGKRKTERERETREHRAGVTVGAQRSKRTAHLGAFDVERNVRGKERNEGQGSESDEVKTCGTKRPNDTSLINALASTQK